jgi:hypothetical protein
VADKSITSDCPQAVYVRSACERCGAVTVATAEILCQPDRYDTDCVSCPGAAGGEFDADAEGYIWQATPESIDAWVDWQLARDREQIALDREMEISDVKAE